MREFNPIRAGFDNVQSWSRQKISGKDHYVRTLRDTGAGVITTLSAPVSDPTLLTREDMFAGGDSSSRHAYLVSTPGGDLKDVVYVTKVGENANIDIKYDGVITIVLEPHDIDEPFETRFLYRRNGELGTIKFTSRPQPDEPPESNLNRPLEDKLHILQEIFRGNALRYPRPQSILATLRPGSLAQVSEGQPEFSLEDYLDGVYEKIMTRRGVQLPEEDADVLGGLAGFIAGGLEQTVFGKLSAEEREAVTFLIVLQLFADLPSNFATLGDERKQALLDRSFTSLVDQYIHLHRFGLRENISHDVTLRIRKSDGAKRVLLELSNTDERDEVFHREEKEIGETFEDDDHAYTIEESDGITTITIKSRDGTVIMTVPNTINTDPIVTRITAEDASWAEVFDMLPTTVENPDSEAA